MIIVRKGRRQDQAALDDFLTRAQRAIRLKGVVGVLITSSQEMRSLNRRFRGQDQATDVLSFPPARIPRTDAAGDLAISVEIAGRNAAKLEHSLADELKILLLHGLLHLAGYDHENDNGEMAAKEMTMRKSLGLPAALIERTRLSASPKRNRTTGKSRNRNRIAPSSAKVRRRG